MGVSFRWNDAWAVACSSRLLHDIMHSKLMYSSWRYERHGSTGVVRRVLTYEAVVYGNANLLSNGQNAAGGFGNITRVHFPQEVLVADAIAVRALKVMRIEELVVSQETFWIPLGGREVEWVFLTRLWIDLGQVSAN